MIHRTCPVPTISYFEEVSSANANGPQQCSFWVLMPISAPMPNSPPSVKRVEAFQWTGGVHFVQELIGPGLIPRDDTVGVGRAVMVDVVDCFPHPVHHPDVQDVVIVF